MKSRDVRRRINRSRTNMQEPDVAELLTVERAVAIIDAAALPALRAARVRLDEAQGLVLARDVVADRDYPPFDKSLMDGYAVRAADVPAGGATLRRVGEIAAGQAAREPMRAGQTMKIMTGAPLPGGADAVVPVEMSKGIDDARVRLDGPAVPWKFIARRGSDCPSGKIVLTRGQTLEATQLAAAASVGAATVEVYPRPRAAVLTTGDEIVGFEHPPGPSQIRNCNSILLVALLRRLGCDASDLGMVGDDPNVIRDAIARALESHDVLLVTGGMSMGDYDYVPRVLRELGADLKITKLRIKPGKPFVFATLGAGKFVFGLPGNPVSAFACTLRLASRLLSRLAGAEPRERWIDASLDAPLPPNGPREFYQPAQRIHAEVGAPRVRGLEWKSSGDVFTLALADCLIVRPENEPARAAGSVVRVLEIPS